MQNYWSPIDWRVGLDLSWPVGVHLSNWCQSICCIWVWSQVSRAGSREEEMDMVWKKQTRTHENKWPMRMSEPMSINLKPESVFLWNIHWSLFASRSSMHIVQVASRKAGVLHHGNIQETSSTFYKTEGENLRSCTTVGPAEDWVTLHWPVWEQRFTKWNWWLGNMPMIYNVELMQQISQSSFRFNLKKGILLNAFVIDLNWCLKSYHNSCLVSNSIPGHVKPNFPYLVPIFSRDFEFLYFWLNKMFAAINYIKRGPWLLLLSHVEINLF